MGFAGFCFFLETRSMDLSPDSDSHSDEKRSVPEYKIEMLLITDYAIYN